MLNQCSKAYAKQACRIDGLSLSRWSAISGCNLGRSAVGGDGSPDARYLRGQRSSPQFCVSLTRRQSIMPDAWRWLLGQLRLDKAKWRAICARCFFGLDG